ncbi:MAG: hypothetical protein COB62_02430 [Piscirickettsiaceae bacterium]|nr:MAG: hypothetical protein COB62_02430 [Piscirickettsiaceae bacterium]
MTITEPGVTLTDYGLAIECAVITYLLLQQRSHSTALFRWFVVFFCVLGLSAFIGGTSHGFVNDESSPFYTLVWNLTLISLGAVAVSAYMISSILFAREHSNKRFSRYIVGAFIVYCGVIILVNNTLLIAITFYLPATASMLAALLWTFYKRRQLFILSGAVGLLLTFIAAGIQQSGYSLHPLWFNHNVIYHVLMAIAIMLLFYTARGFIAMESR